MNPLYLFPVYAVLVLLYGYLGLSKNFGSPRMLKLCSKMACSILFVATALVARVYSPKASSFWFGMMLASLVLSLAGDLFLALPKHDGPQNSKWFLFGTFCFLCTHILLITLYLVWGGFSYWAILCALLLEGACLLAAKKLDLQFGKLAPVVLLYSAVILFMLCSAVTLLLQKISVFSALVAAGSFLFFASDCLLALDVFSQKPKGWRGFLNTVTYFGGQFLLALSIAFV